MFTHNQKVVCVDDKFPLWALQLYTALPVKGQTYTVRALSPCGQAIDLETNRFEQDLVVYLHELRNPDDPRNTKHKIELGFRVERFVPLNEVDATDKMETSNELVPA